MIRSRRNLGNLALLVLPCVLAVGTRARAAEECRAWCPDAQGAGRLDLTRVSYEIDVYGAVALGKLTQEFQNAGKEPVVGAYRMPQSRLRVDRLDVRVAGDVVEPSAPAKDARGARAVPATRERQGAQAGPRVTVEPGAPVEVVADFRLTLPVETGLLRLRVPAPNLEALAGGRERLASPAGDPEHVPVTLRVVIHHDEPLAVAKSPSHEIVVDFDGSQSVVELAQGDLDGREFELDFAIGPEDAPTLLAHVGPERNGLREVVAVLTPPSKPPAESARPKQVIFVLDTSGSMRGGKLEQARLALDASLHQLSAADHFNIIEFDGSFTTLRDEPVVADAAALEAASAWLLAQRSGGSTKLLPALAAAFAQAQTDERHDMIVVLTDGNVQDAPQVENLLESKLGSARLFFVGVGEDMKQEALMRFAEIGRGTAAFAENAEHIGSTVAVLFDSVAQPLAWDLEIDWGGAKVERIEPARLPDLYAGRPVTVFATVRGTAPSAITLNATTMDGAQAFSVVLPPATEEPDPRRP